jgi:hypothetical protein
MKLSALFAACLLFVMGTTASAVDHRVEPLNEPAPAEAISPEIAAALQPGGVRVLRGGSRTVADLWLAKQWNAKADFKPTAAVLYPFEAGTLIGVIRFKNKGSDFRGQEIPAGVYTVRYALQPVDGNHVGTSDTRDFLLLLPGKEDAKAAAMDPMTMIQLSPKVTGTTHPAMMALLRSEAAEAKPSIRHDEERDLWSVRLQGTANAAGKSQPQPIEIVVAGQAEG